MNLKNHIKFNNETISLYISAREFSPSQRQEINWKIFQLIQENIQLYSELNKTTNKPKKVLKHKLKTEKIFWLSEKERSSRFSLPIFFESEITSEDWEREAEAASAINKQRKEAGDYLF